MLGDRAGSSEKQIGVDANQDTLQQLRPEGKRVMVIDGLSKGSSQSP